MNNADLQDTVPSDPVPLENPDLKQLTKERDELQQANLKLRRERTHLMNKNLDLVGHASGLKESLKQQQELISQIENSVSFRVARWATAVPRFLRDIFSPGDINN